MDKNTIHVSPESPVLSPESVRESASPSRESQTPELQDGLRTQDSGLSDDTGSSLIEVVVAMLIMGTIAAGLLAMSALALTRSENQGHLAARTAEYAQDKMEQLLVLTFGDVSTDTRVFPATPAGGTGMAAGGSSNPAAPVAGYADYLDANGNLLVSNGGAPPAGWFYQRVWQVTSLSPTLKRVTVTAIVARAIGRTQRPSATLVSLKSFPF